MIMQYDVIVLKQPPSTEPWEAVLATTFNKIQATVPKGISLLLNFMKSQKPRHAIIGRSQTPHRIVVTRT